MRSLHAAAGVGARAAGRLADLLDQQLPEARNVGPREKAVDPVVGRDVGDEVVDDGGDRGRGRPGGRTATSAAPSSSTGRLASAKAIKNGNVVAGKASGHRGSPQGWRPWSAAPRLRTRRAAGCASVLRPGVPSARPPPACRARPKTSQWLLPNPRLPSPRPARPATLAQAARAVFWSFFGVRKGKRHAARRGRPAAACTVIVVGVAPPRSSCWR